MPKRLLSRDYVRQKLESLKCRQVKELVTTTLWETASGVWFSVPHQTPEKRTDSVTLDEIVKQIETWNLFTGFESPDDDNDDTEDGD